MDVIWQRILLIGIVPLCNGIASRAPHFFGYCFILCYRCTFILVFGIGTLWYLKKKTVSSIKYIWILLIPMIIDGSLQTFMDIPSTNFRRTLTGAVFGIGIGYIIKYLWQKVDAL